MARHLLRMQQPGIDHLLHLAVILAHTAEFAVTPTIEAAVAGPERLNVLVHRQQHDDRAGNDGIGAELGGAGPQRTIDGGQLADGGFDEGVESARRLDRTERGDDAGARKITGVMSAHPIGDRPDAEIGAIEKRVLITLPHQPDMGQPMRDEAERIHGTAL